MARAQAEMIREHLPHRRAALTLALMAAGVGGRAVVRRVLGDSEGAATMRGWWRGYRSG